MRKVIVFIVFYMFHVGISYSSQQCGVCPNIYLTTPPEKWMDMIADLAVSHYDSCYTFAKKGYYMNSVIKGMRNEVYRRKSELQRELDLTDEDINNMVQLITNSCKVAYYDYANHVYRKNNIYNYVINNTFGAISNTGRYSVPSCYYMVSYFRAYNHKRKPIKMTYTDILMYLASAISVLVLIYCFYVEYKEERERQRKNVDPWKRLMELMYKE